MDSFEEGFAKALLLDNLPEYLSKLFSENINYTKDQWLKPNKYSIMEKIGYFLCDINKVFPLINGSFDCEIEPEYQNPNTVIIHLELDCIDTEKIFVNFKVRDK